MLCENFDKTGKTDPDVKWTWTPEWHAKKTRDYLVEDFKTAHAEEPRGRNKRPIPKKPMKVEKAPYTWDNLDPDEQTDLINITRNRIKELTEIGEKQRKDL